MSEAEQKGPEPSAEDGGTGNTEADQSFGSILKDIERFSHISSELKDCLSVITRKIINSMDELKSVQQDVARKRLELKDLCEIEASAAELNKLQEEQRLKQSELEKAMENQHRLWEEEKALKEKENEEYRQALKLRREREEEDYKQKLAREQSAIRQKLEEELRRSLQRDNEKEALLKKDLIEREQALKDKEREWNRLIHELELFMTRLVERTRRKSAVGDVAATGLDGNSDPKSGGIDPGTSAISIKERDEAGAMEIAPALNGTEEPSVPSIRELLLSQERRIENIQANLKDNREPVPFRLPPKDNA